MSNPRADFSPIFDREPLKLPGGARVAVWPVINVEEWDINEPMARTVLPTPQGVSVIPDIPNFGWFDYGLRVGFWRMKQVLDNHGIRATVSLNASVCLSYPHLVEESLKSGWEMLAHGFIQRVINKEPDERAVIRKSISTIQVQSNQRGCIATYLLGKSRRIWPRFRGAWTEGPRRRRKFRTGKRRGCWRRPFLKAEK